MFLYSVYMYCRSTISCISYQINQFNFLHLVQLFVTIQKTLNGHVCGFLIVQYIGNLIDLRWVDIMVTNVLHNCVVKNSYNWYFI